MQRRTQFRSPLVGWPRRSGVGPETSFGHRFLRPIALIVVIGFVLVDAFLVIRLTQDDSTTSTRPGSSVNDSGPMTTSDRLGKQLGDLDQTEIGTPIIAGKAVARLQGNDRSERKPRHEASAAGAETVVSSSTSSTGTSASGSSSGGSSSGGSSSGGSSSGGSSSGGSSSGGSSSGGSSSGGSSSGGSGGSGGSGSGSGSGSGGSGSGGSGSEEGGPAGGGP